MRSVSAYPASCLSTLPSAVETDIRAAQYRVSSLLSEFQTMCRDNYEADLQIRGENWLVGGEAASLYFGFAGFAG